MSTKDAGTPEELMKKISTYIKNRGELKNIERAYEYAKEKHGGQYRKSGEEYIYHPLNTAFILTTIFADAESIMASLLHDVLEDCDVEKEEIAELFGESVANLVHGVTKLGKINFSTENEYLIEYYKKIIVGMSEDVRIIIIKLADRLHNMRTLWALTEDKQKKIAKETLEILSPIAHHLGIYKIKSELEDLSLRYLKPDVFYDIAERLNTTKLERNRVVEDMQLEVSNLLKEHQIKHEIKGRAKSIYSIYKKLDSGRKFSDIYDLLALRILVATEQECYLALGLIHSKFKPIPKRFKDYIAMPKSNMYQSLHTTVFGTDGAAFEIQIRTYSMNEIAENGVASHWAYKEKRDAATMMKNTTEQKLQFFKTIIDLNSDKMSSEDFVNSVRDEVLNNNIYVFTPKGDIFELPKGSTPIDFAYKIHTKVGETMVGAIVNNNIVPLNYELHNNDIVKINTNKNSTPSKEWLNIAKATQTKNKIKAYFSKTERDLNIEKGKDSLEKELRKRKISFADFWTNENLAIIFKELKLDNQDDLYMCIGNGKHQPNSVINIIYKKEEVKIKPKKEIKKDVDADIIVAGIDKVKVNLANCCNPIPGDEIIGYITKGNGISVHRNCCHNLAFFENRTVLVDWNKNVNKRFLTSVIIYSDTRENHLLDILQNISMYDAPVDKATLMNHSDDANYELDLLVRNNEQLEKIIREIEKLKFVRKVERLIK